jgi:ABC-type enterobactin transport system permease subunit
MWKKPVRIGVYVLVAFVIGSLILGTIKGNAFVDNLVYGLETGVIAGVIVAVILFGVSTVRHRTT